MTSETSLADQAVRRLDRAPSPELVAVIPAAGEGGEMYPLTAAMPKALVPIDDMPLLVHILKGLDASVFKEALVLCDVWHRMISHYLEAFKSDIKLHVTCLQRPREEKPPAALQALLSQLSDPFLLHYCDILLEPVDWTDVYNEYHRKKHRNDIIAMALVSAEFQYPVGVANMDSKGLITQFRQKPGGILAGYANCAVALLSKQFVLDYVNPKDQDVFDYSLDQASRKGRVGGFSVGHWHHLQQLRDWLEAQKDHYPHLND